MTQQLSWAEKAGKNLKKLIKEREMTQERFAEEICVDPVTVRRWIHSGIKSTNTLEEIARLFNVGFEELLK